MIKGILYATAISLLVYAWIAVWFNLTAFVVLIIVSMLCLIGAERIRRVQMRRGREAVWARRKAEARAAGLNVIDGGQDPDWLFKAPFWQLPDEVQR